MQKIWKMFWGMRSVVVSLMLKSKRKFAQSEHAKVSPIWHPYHFPLRGNFGGETDFSKNPDEKIIEKKTLINSWLKMIKNYGGIKVQANKTLACDIGVFLLTNIVYKASDLQLLGLQDVTS